ncbi:MAG TPA: hypothetical protein VFV01_02410 [Spirillospora sp.]|nr:hypothetical protein [Spirillospora sp.]
MAGVLLVLAGWGTVALAIGFVVACFLALAVDRRPRHRGRHRATF